MKSWPLFDLRISEGDITLRMMQDLDLDLLAHAAVGNILEPDQAGFFMTNWALEKSPNFQINFVQHHWRTRANWHLDDWSLNLGLFIPSNPSPVGVFTLFGNQFALRKSVLGASWLIKKYQNQGLGYRGRKALLEFAFNYLGADEARSIADSENIASNKLSEKLGFVFDGTEIEVTGDQKAHLSNRYVLYKKDWSDDTKIQVEGFHQCKKFFGL